MQHIKQIVLNLQDWLVYLMINVESYDDYTKLSFDETPFICIPRSIILDKSLSDKRIYFYSYFAFGKGINNKVRWSIADVCEYGRYKENKHKGKINDQIKSFVAYMCENNYFCNTQFTVPSKLQTLVVTEKFVNRKGDDKNNFAMVYADEADKILGYRLEEDSEKTINPAAVLLVFSYLRMKIPIRYSFQTYKGKEYKNTKVDTLPEVYDNYLTSIGEEIGLSRSAVAKSVSVLEKLDLIATRKLPCHVTKKTGKFDEHNDLRSGTTMFCNTYKREKGRLIDMGIDYINREMDLKEKLLMKKFPKMFVQMDDYDKYVQDNIESQQNRRCTS